MKLARFALALSAVVYLVRSVALLFAPDKFYSMYGIPINDSVLFWTAQFLGADMLLITMINWYSFRHLTSPFIKNILLANIIFEAIAIVLWIKGIGLFNTMVFATLILDSLILVLCISAYVGLNKHFGKSVKH